MANIKAKTADDMWFSLLDGVAYNQGHRDIFNEFSMLAKESADLLDGVDNQKQFVDTLHKIDIGKEKRGRGSPIS